jgi:heat shock protein HslJ
MMTRTIIKIAVIFVGFIFIFSCKPVMQQEHSQSPKLAGAHWVLINTADYDSPEYGQATLSFGDDGRAYGTDGCNRYSTPYAEDKDTLTFSEHMIMTKMACLEETMTRAADFINAVTATKKFRREAHILILMDENDRELARMKNQE